MSDVLLMLRVLIAYYPEFTVSFYTERGTQIKVGPEYFGDQYFTEQLEYPLIVDERRLATICRAFVLSPVVSYEITQRGNTNQTLDVSAPMCPMSRVAADKMLSHLSNTEFVSRRFNVPVVLAVHISLMADQSKLSVLDPIISGDYCAPAVAFVESRKQERPAQSAIYNATGIKHKNMHPDFVKIYKSASLDAPVVDMAMELNYLPTDAYHVS